MCYLLCLNHSTSHPLSSFWLNPVGLSDSTLASTSFRNLPWHLPYAQPLVYFSQDPVLSSVIAFLQVSVCKSALEEQHVPLIPASLDSDLVPGTGRYTCCIRGWISRRGNGERHFLTVVWVEEFAKPIRWRRLMWGKKWTAYDKTRGRDGENMVGSKNPQGLAEMPMARNEADTIHIDKGLIPPCRQWEDCWRALSMEVTYSDLYFRTGVRKPELMDQLQPKITKLQREGAG